MKWRQRMREIFLEEINGFQVFIKKYTDNPAQRGMKLSFW